MAAGFETPTLFTIANDLKDMQVVADVDEADIGYVAEGQRVEFTVDAYPDDVFTGNVKQVRLEATTESSVVTYEVVISASNPDLKLKPGLYGQCDDIYIRQTGRVCSSVQGSAVCAGYRTPFQIGFKCFRSSCRYGRIRDGLGCRRTDSTSGERVHRCHGRRCHRDHLRHTGGRAGGSGPENGSTGSQVTGTAGTQPLHARSPEIINTAMRDIIRLEDIRRDFIVGEETVHALRGVSFNISEGEFVIVTATSGSGK